MADSKDPNAKPDVGAAGTSARISSSDLTEEVAWDEEAAPAKPSSKLPPPLPSRGRRGEGSGKAVTPVGLGPLPGAASSAPGGSGAGAAKTLMGPATPLRATPPGITAPAPGNGPPPGKKPRSQPPPPPKAKSAPPPPLSRSKSTPPPPTPLAPPPPAVPVIAATPPAPPASAASSSPLPAPAPPPVHAATAVATSATATPVAGRPADPVSSEAPNRPVPPPTAAAPAPLPRPAAPPQKRGPAATPRPLNTGPARGQPRPARVEPPELRTELRQRAERLKAKEPVGAARAFVELAIHEERVVGDGKSARKSYEAARALARDVAAAHGRLRRLVAGKAELPVALDALGDEIRLAEDNGQRASLLAERARLLETAGRRPDARKSFEEALTFAPRHPDALRGLESLHRRDLGRGPESATRAPDGPASLLSAHLDRITAALSDAEPKLAAWTEVERAELCDGILDQAEPARAALDRAASLDPSRPVRDALRRHLVRRNDLHDYVDALLADSEEDDDDHRSARYAYAAARILIDKLDQPARAIEVLSKAANRAPTGTSTRRRVLASLVPLLEAAGDLPTAAEARQLTLAEISEPEVLAHGHVTLSDLHASVGDPARAAEHAARALQYDPDDATILQRLDRTLDRLGRHDDRVALWVSQGNGRRPTPLRVAAFVRAADLAARRLGRRDEALSHLRAAWVLDPGNGEVFDAMASLLAPPPEDESSPQGRNARERIELYMLASNAAKSAARKVALLESAAHVWENELGHPERAFEALERALEIEPHRASAILALSRNAARAGDAWRLARGLVAEAQLTPDKALARRLLLRAADALYERLGDREQALALVDQALSTDATDPDALRARYRLLDVSGRHEEARKALVTLAARDPATAFSTWMEIARLDEVKLKRPHDAVRAYQEAARVRPRHPAPQAEIARLLRKTNDHKRLCEILTELVPVAPDAQTAARLLFEVAEVQELRVGDDHAALATLERADGLLGAEAYDPSILEATERILVRRHAHKELAALYDRWLARDVPAAEARRIRLALAWVVGDADKKRALDALEPLLAQDPADLPALRRTEHLLRAAGAHDRLSSIVAAEADAMTSAEGKSYALWELASHEEALGAQATLALAERIVAGSPTDAGAVDMGIRIAGRLVADAADPATVSRLVALVEERRKLAGDAFARAAWLLEAASLRERASGDARSAAKSALDGYGEALSRWPDSLLAARGVERLGRTLADGSAVLTAELALSKIVEAPSQRAEHLVRAAEITAQLGGKDATERVVGLYEQALSVDPDNAAAATALATALGGDTARLAQRLGDALERARVSEQIVLLGSAVGAAALRPTSSGSGPSGAVGIEALRKVLAEAPKSTDALRTLAGLLEAQQLWQEAESVLAHLADVAGEPALSASALFELARVYEGPLRDAGSAEAAYERVLAIDGKHRYALEGLGRMATARNDRPRTVQILRRLVEIDTDAPTRLGHELALARVLRESGETAEAVHTLVAAIVGAPGDPRAWNELASMYATDTPDGALGYSKALKELLDAASTKRLAPSATWLTTLGLLEVTSLRKIEDGLARLRKAAELPTATADVHVALGRGLEAAGLAGEAVKALRSALTPDPQTFARADSAVALAALESALGKDRRSEEREVVEEVRALLGDAHKESLRAFRTRPLPAEALYPNALAGEALTQLLVPEAQSAFVEVALAMAPVVAKALQFDLAKLGVSSRDRIGVRDGNPTRALADRIGKALGLAGFELYLTAGWQGAPRVYPGDPAVVVGSPSFCELSEPEQAFALARLLTRATLGFAWLDELSLEAADGLLMASVRAIDPDFGDGALSVERERMVQSLLPLTQKAIGRRQRKLIEPLVPNLSAGLEARTFTIGLRRSEYRVAYAMSGNLTATMDYLRRYDAELARTKSQPRSLAAHPVTNELMRWAISAECWAVRRSLGT